MPIDLGVNEKQELVFRNDWVHLYDFLKTTENLFNKERQNFILGKEFYTLVDLEKKHLDSLKKVEDFVKASAIDDIQRCITLYESEFNVDSISIGQLASKRWLIEIMEDLQERKKIKLVVRMVVNLVMI